MPQRVQVKVYLDPSPPHSYLECLVREDRDLYPRPHMTHRNLSSPAETPSIMGLAVSIQGGLLHMGPLLIRNTPSFYPRRIARFSWQHTEYTTRSTHRFCCSTMDREKLERSMWTIRSSLKLARQRRLRKARVSISDRCLINIYIVAKLTFIF